jgi:hypothetical protein
MQSLRRLAHFVSLVRYTHHLAALEDRRNKSEFPGDERTTTLTLKPPLYSLVAVEIIG